MGTKSILLAAFALLTASLIFGCEHFSFGGSTLDALKKNIKLEKKEQNSTLGLGVDLWLLCNQELAQRAFFIGSSLYSLSHVLQPANVLCDLHRASQLLQMLSYEKLANCLSRTSLGEHPRHPVLKKN